jgi:hypothetical protein
MEQYFQNKAHYSKECLYHIVKIVIEQSYNRLEGDYLKELKS